MEYSAESLRDICVSSDSGEEGGGSCGGTQIGWSSGTGFSKFGHLGIQQCYGMVHRELTMVGKAGLFQEGSFSCPSEINRPYFLPWLIHDESCHNIIESLSTTTTYLENVSNTLLLYENE